MNVGGGYLDGDRYKMDFTAEKDASVILTSQGATKNLQNFKRSCRTISELYS